MCAFQHFYTEMKPYTKYMNLLCKSIHETLHIFLNHIIKDATEWSVFVLNIILKWSLLKTSHNFVHFTLGISDEKSERTAENNS